MQDRQSRPQRRIVQNRQRSSGLFREPTEAFMDFDPRHKKTTLWLIIIKQHARQINDFLVISNSSWQLYLFKLYEYSSYIQIKLFKRVGLPKEYWCRSHIPRRYDAEGRLSSRRIATGDHRLLCCPLKRILNCGIAVGADDSIWGWTLPRRATICRRRFENRGTRPKSCPTSLWSAIWCSRPQDPKRQQNLDLIWIWWSWLLQASGCLIFFRRDLFWATRP